MKTLLANTVLVYLTGGFKRQKEMKVYAEHENYFMA